MPSHRIADRILVKSQIQKGITSTKRICSRTGVNARTVRRIKARLRMGLGIADRPRSGRPRKRTSTFRRSLGQIKSKMPYAPAHVLNQELRQRGKTSVSISTVQRALHDSGYRWKPLPRRKLTSAQKTQRISFCEAHKDDSFSQTWMFDEVYFNLYRHANRYWISVYSEERMEKPKLTQAQLKVSIGACFAVSRGKKSDLCFLKKNWNAPDLVKEFENTLLPSIKWPKRPSANQRFIVDNDGRHWQSDFIQFVERSKLHPIRPWPANSPDFNCAENVNAWLKKEVESASPTKELELKEAILKAYQDFPVDFTVHLVDSMPSRLEDCLARKGGRTRY